MKFFKYDFQIKITHLSSFTEILKSIYNYIIEFQNFFGNFPKYYIKIFFQNTKFTSKIHSNIQTHPIKYKINIPKSTHVY